MNDEQQITLSYTYRDIELTMKFSGECTWPEAFAQFRQFLNGIGFQVPNGEWVEDDDDAADLEALRQVDVQSVVPWDELRGPFLEDKDV